MDVLFRAADVLEQAVEAAVSQDQAATTNVDGAAALLDALRSLEARSDDAIFMRTMVGDILQQAGFEIVGEAETGVQAVEKYKQLRPDLVTMDIVMPDMGGIDAVREITKFDANAKVLMCSAMGQQALVVEAIQAGAKDFVVKPFQPSRVLEAVQRVLG
jgi:two-component system chemotaxis response regulator CheY